MLCFALKYKQVVKSMMEMRELDLCELELSPEEGKLVQQLAGVLKVCHAFQTIESSNFFITNILNVSMLLQLLKNLQPAFFIICSLHLLDFSVVFFCRF